MTSSSLPYCTAQHCAGMGPPRFGRGAFIELWSRFGVRPLTKCIVTRKLQPAVLWGTSETLPWHCAEPSYGKGRRMLPFQIKKDWRRKLATPPPPHLPKLGGVHPSPSQIHLWNCVFSTVPSIASVSTSENSASSQIGFQYSVVTSSQGRRTDIASCNTTTE